MLARPQPVEIVEHFEGRRIPVGPVRRLGRAGGSTRGRAATATGWSAGQAEIDEGAAIVVRTIAESKRIMTGVRFILPP
jgi:hypothetical protein